MMRATEIEFKHRFWFIGGIFWLGFACYSFDHQNAAIALLKFFSGGKVDPNSAAANGPAHLIFAFAALLCILAAALRTWGAAYLRSDVVHDHALHSERLVADGPFRWMRNPLYDGGILLAAGIGFLASPLGWLVMTLGLLLFYYRLVLREEAALLESQDESFRAYLKAVPRFLPSLRPRVPSSGAPPRWGQAFGGEIFTWGFAASVVVYAATLQIRTFWVALGLSLVGYALYWIARGRTAKQKPPARAD